MNKILSDPETFKIIGCAMKVHRVLGNGFQEVIYQRALKIEFEKNNIEFSREPEISIYYNEIEVGTRRVDFLINNNILVELKAIIKLEDVHLAQGKNYLESFRLSKGLIINFGGKSLECKRLINTKFTE